jgi:hypothetical protein
MLATSLSGLGNFGVEGFEVVEIDAALQPRRTLLVEKHGHSNLPLEGPKTVSLYCVPSNLGRLVDAKSQCTDSLKHSMINVET